VPKISFLIDTIIFLEERKVIYAVPPSSPGGQKKNFQCQSRLFCSRAYPFFLKTNPDNFSVQRGSCLRAKLIFSRGEDSNYFRATLVRLLECHSRPFWRTGRLFV
jgi:hypothetical protein